MAKRYKLIDIVNNVENPRFIKDDKFFNLVNSIISFPQMMRLRPITVDENNISLGGNMRKNACIEIQKIGEDACRLRIKDLLKNRYGEDYEISDDDIAKINENLSELQPIFKGYFPEGWIQKKAGLTPQQKDEFILKDNSQFGEWDFDMLANQYEEWQLNEAEIWTPLDEDDATFGEGEEVSDKYTNKIEAPIYEIKGDKPPLSELVNTDKYEELIENIEKSDVSGKIKEFLRIAATRHYTFSYKKIAEFYAHADKDVQELFEQSALVIIDFDKAIENGYVNITDEINERFKDE